MARKSYPLIKYLCVLCITIGVAIFVYKDDKAAKSSGEREKEREKERKRKKEREREKEREKERKKDRSPTVEPRSNGSAFNYFRILSK